MTDQPLLEDRPSPTEARPSVLASPTLPLPPPREVNRGEPIERQVPVEEETLVTLRVPPRAICQLYHPGNPDRRRKRLDRHLGWRGVAREIEHAHPADLGVEDGVLRPPAADGLSRRQRLIDPRRRGMDGDHLGDVGHGDRPQA